MTKEEEKPKIKEKVEPSNKRPEVFIGLVGPTGVDLIAVHKELFKALEKVGYKPEVIKLSEILEKSDVKKIHQLPISAGRADMRINSLMDAGNVLREKMKCKEALSLLTISQVRDIRKRETGEWDQTIDAKAYIFHSFKNKDEIELFKKVYGPAFFLISAYSPRDKRLKNLAKRIAKSDGKPSQHKKYLAEAEGLMKRDFDEENQSYGQQVREAFPLADLFVEVDTTPEKLEDSIDRFVSTIFGYPYYTPTKAEFGMFLAFSVALRSADLSRQVGAAIMNDNGELLSIGCNEVPKYGGGQYWEDDDIEKVRDFELGYDSSALMKREILEETITSLQDTDIISDSRKPGDIVEELLHGEFEKQMKNADITNLLEYGRMVHAEMAAISDAAKRGISLEGATLYCTTFPCHMCARHIIAAGIKKVVYVEPYPKSKAAELYPDSIVVDPEVPVKSKVTFVPFTGIAPYRFHDFFKYSTKRKDSKGRTLTWSAREAKPKIEFYNPIYIYINENDVMGVVAEIFEDLETP